MKQLFREQTKKIFLARKLSKWYRAHTSGHPNWRTMLKNDAQFWQNSLQQSLKGSKILIATSLGGHFPGTIMESLLAVSLTLRGTEVHVLLCDKVLPACQECIGSWFSNDKRFVENGPQKDLCNSCFGPAFKMFNDLGIKVHRYSEFLTNQDKQKAAQIAKTLDYSNIKNFRMDGLAIGEHALAGALRYYAKAVLDREAFADQVLRRYCEASILTAYSAKKLMQSYRFEAAVFHHGIYVPQGIIGEVARQEKVRVINWNPAYRKQCFIFSHEDTYHHTLMNEPVASWENMHWNESVETELMEYLKSRWHGSKDWIWFHERPQLDLQKIAEETGVDFAKPCIGMLTNVMWDAQLHYPANAFPNMLEWVLQTIDYFIKRPELQLLIRIHPAEIRGTIPSRQLIAGEVKKRYPVLPSNIILIPPESQVSTYAAMLQCNSVIIYGTKTGVELTSMGMPVIVAGEAWIRNKGITMDAASKDEYFKLLDFLPLDSMMDKDVVLRARKYAYHFFFRRMVPIHCMKPTGEWPPYEIKLSTIKDLLPGIDLGLDVICDGIQKGTEFIFPAEINQKIT